MNATLKRMRNERGVAMVTVLLVGASLTAVASVAAFGTVREFRATADDRRATTALAIAESGVDRMVELLRSGTVTWGEIRLAGCDATHPKLTSTGSVGEGSFQAEFQVYEPNETLSTTCATRAGQDSRPPKNTARNFAIVSKGTHPTASRVVRQVLAIKALGLPVGIYADNIESNGSPDFAGVSMLSPNDVQGRDKMSFKGTDPYYALSDFWPSMNSTTAVPAAIHSTGTIYSKKLLFSTQEHTSSQPKNCTANGPQGTGGQSLWDQSKDGGEITSTCAQWLGPNPNTPAGPGTGTFPPTSLFTSADLERVTPRPKLSDQDYLTLRSSAKQTGLYCFIATGGAMSCTKRGEQWDPQTGLQGAVIVDQTPVNFVMEVNKDFVAYFEFQDATKAQTTNDVDWRASVTPCSDDPALNRSATIIVRNGSYDKGAGNEVVNGALIVPEGDVVVLGDHTIHGTVIAKRVDLKGTQHFQMDPCWVNNMPGPFLDVTPGAWSELDR